MELRDIVSDSRQVSIKSSASVSDALVAMIENKIDYLLIERDEADDAYGIVTRWDLVEGPIAKGVDLKTAPVMDYARKPLVVMNNLDLDLRWVARKMTNENVSKIAVFDGESFLGFISDVDILKAVAAKRRKAKEAKE